LNDHTSGGGCGRIARSSTEVSLRPVTSDAWVCSPNPFTARWAIVDRKADTGASLDASESISFTEALRAYT